ncbi:hypothetical protein ACQEVZ_45405 [Dactylosporangium sp. CA-152071]|uniref:hypothetical protein n=1 Tax=Dactylosporangium sp. CA-152071 TaxID=3239933 RepID=UPI003D90D29B
MTSGECPHRTSHPAGSPTPHLAGHLIPPWYDPFTIGEATDTWRMRQQVLIDVITAQDAEQLERWKPCAA